MNNNPIIEVNDLNYTYTTAEERSLKNINLEVYPGEYVAILGLSGAGKTTLCLSLNGIIPHMIMGVKDGECIVNGVDIDETSVRELAKSVGMVFDNPEYQLTQLTVKEEVALGLENLGTPYEEMLVRIEEALEIVGLEGLEERSPKALSGGQQQRLAIAAALAMYPDVLILDEPTSNLDPQGKKDVFEVLRKLNQEQNMTIVIAEHEVEVIAEYADRIIILQEGELIKSGTPEKVFNDVQSVTDAGLRVPQVTEFGHVLRKKGYTISGKLPITLEDGIDKYSNLGV
ncbi:MAG: energy-coupling factor ABC transporter ATP-binding protein [Halanaerobiaceae bacterium]